MKPVQKWNRWEIVYRVPGYKNPFAERFDTQEEANIRIAEIEYAKRMGTLKPPSRVEKARILTLSEFLDEYVANYGANNWGDSYYSINRHRIDDYVKPYIGEMLLRDITTRTLDEYYNKLLSTPAVILKGHKDQTKTVSYSVIAFSGYKYSPCKQKIIYLVSQPDLKENKSFKELYIMNSDGTENKLISEPDDNIAEPTFIMNGEKIAYIQKGELYMMNLDGTSKKKISNDCKINSDIEGFLFNENLTKLILVKSVKVEGLQVKKGNDVYPDCDKATNCYIADDLCYTHWNTLQNQIQRPFIYDVKYDKEKDDILIDEKSEINLLEKYTFECPSTPFGGMEEIDINKDGSKIYFVCKRFTGKEYSVSTNTDLFEYTEGKDEILNICKGVYENKNNLRVNIYEGIDFTLSFKNQQNIIQNNVMKIYGDKTFYKKDENGKVDMNLGYNLSPKLSPDNKMICWISMERDGYESDVNKLCVFNFETKEKFYISEGLDTFISSFAWSLDNKTIYFSAVWEGAYQIYKTDIIGKKVEKLTNEISNFNNITILDTEHLLATKCSMKQPNDLYAIDLINKSIKQLTFINKEKLDDIKPVQVEKRIVETFDRKSMLCWVIYPPDFDPSKKYPTLLYCQGGPQSAVSQFFSTRWNFFLMASHG